MTAMSGPGGFPPAAPAATEKAAAGAETPAAAAWTATPERGTDGALRLMLWILRRLGWRAGHLLLYPIAGYFLLTSPRQWRHSRAFLRRALGREPGVRDLFRVWFAFSSTILDRVFLASGRTAEYRIEVEGVEALEAVLAEGRGCLLLGAHVGNFEVLRAVADAGSPVELAVLMYEASARRAHAMAHAFGGPRHAAAVIPIGTPDAMLRARECLERGGMVGLLADRCPHGERVARVPFLGEEAPLPLGPHLLAGMLGAPVVLAFGIWRGPRDYLVRFEPFAEAGSPCRGARDAAAAESAARYAARLEAVCRAYPHNWFNFHDFWDEAR